VSLEDARVEEPCEAYRISVALERRAERCWKIVDGDGSSNETA